MTTILQDDDLIVCKDEYNVMIWHEDGIRHFINLPLDATKREIQIAIDAFRAGQFDIKHQVCKGLADVVDFPQDWLI